MILITGAHGFIGKKLTPLIKTEFKGEKVFAVDKDNFDLIKGGLSALPKNPRIIFHLASVTDTAVRGHEKNVILTKNLLGALKNIGPKTHIIFTSTQAVFSGRKNCKKPIDEHTKPVPNNKYGESKLRVEKLLLEASWRRKFKLTIIRLPTVVGDNPRKNSFLNLLKKMINDDSLLAKFDWPGKVGLIALPDLCKYLVDISTKAPGKPKIISICTQNLTLAEIFEKLMVTQGKKYKQIKLPGFVWSAARYLRPYLKYFEWVLPAAFYNLFWRASIVVDSPLWCKENIRGTKLTF